MVQLGSSAGYDGFVEEHRPQDGDISDEGLSGAVHALIDSVNATSRQFAEAAEGFANETMRVMEGYMSRVDHSASESRDMAGLAGRAVDEARKVSDEARAAIDGARDQVRAEVESLMAEMRSQLDEALRSTSESVASARQAAEESEQRGREAGERVDQSVAASREAATAAEAAAEAAHRSVEGIEQAAAQARESMLEQANRTDGEAMRRMEESLAASREAAGAAERAAEDARAAAVEAMNYAAEAKNPAGESGLGAEAHELLDRLEADYQLLTELVHSLHSRLAGLGAPEQDVSPTVVPDTAAESEAPADNLLQPSLAWGEPETNVELLDSPPAQADKHPEESGAAATWYSQAQAEEEASAEPEVATWDAWHSGPADTVAPAAWPETSPEADISAPRWDAGAEASAREMPSEEDAPKDEGATRLSSPAEVEPARPESEPTWATSALYAEEPEDEEAEVPSWPAPTASTPHDAVESGSSPWTSEVAPAEGPARIEDGVPSWLAPSVASDWTQTEPDAATPAATGQSAAVAEGTAEEPGTSTWASDAPVQEAPAETAAPSWLASAWNWESNGESASIVAGAEADTTPEPDTDAEDAERAEPAVEALVLTGRVVLKVSPVPDFDRLLSLDGALGRMPFIRSVTLADYAKEEVTFRIELHDSTSVEDFINELSRTSGQSLEIVAVSPGELEMKILWAGS